MLVDDDLAAAEGVVALIQAQPGYHVYAAAAEIDTVLRTVRENKPELVILNLRQEGDDSLALVGALHGETPEARIILMGLESSQTDVASYVRAGVSGFVIAGASFAVFLHTIQSVANGIRVLPAGLTPSLFGQLKKYSIPGRPRRTMSVGQLTGREQEVANLIVQGFSNKAIATKLKIALDTVKCHVHRVLSKLAINSRLEVAAFSQEGTAPEPQTAYPRSS